MELDVPFRRSTPRNLDYPTHGPIAARIASACGRPFMPWQAYTADLALEYDPETGRFIHPTHLIMVPRQGGKTTLLIPWMNTLALLRARARIWYTAQTGKDASEWFVNEAMPAMGPMDHLVHHRRPSGSESWTYHHNRSIVRMFAPQRDSLHGKQSDGVFLDEAWAHTDLRGAELLQAIGPTQATRTRQAPGPQVGILSAAGDASSTFLIAQLRQFRSSLARMDHGDVLVEFGVPDDEDATDPDVAARYHPAVGHTIERSYLYAERKRLGPDGFARAYGCRQIMPDLASGAVIPLDDWNACRDDAPIPDGARVAGFGVEVAPDRSFGAIVAVTTSGVLEVIHVEHGTAWIAPAAVKLGRDWNAPVVIDDYGPAATVSDRIREEGDPRLLLTPSTREVGTASARIHDDIVSHELVHRTNPDLDLAVESASTRPLGDGAWTWNRRAGGGPIVPLVAATMAWFAYTRSRLGPS